jgi:hypothetical protein
MRRQRVLAMALLCVAAVTAAPVLGTADAKKKKKKQSIAGKFAGLTEYDGTVSFKLTRTGKVLNFTLTNATLYCHTDVPHENPTYFPEYTKVVTITHGPMSMKKLSKKNPQGKRFEASDPFTQAVASSGGYFKGSVASLGATPNGGRVTGTGMAGETSWETTNGPFGVPGTEWCVSKLIDWEAKRPKDKGFVLVGGSGHMRPPLSEF